MGGTHQREPFDQERPPDQATLFSVQGDQRRTPAERGVFAVLGAFVVVGALWLTALGAFVTSPNCGGPNAIPAVAGKALWGAVVTLIVTPAWLCSVSLFRLAGGRPALRRRSWVGATLALAALAFVPFAVVFANEPPPSSTCQPFEMD